MFQQNINEFPGKVIVTTDFSPVSYAAFAYAAYEASAPGASLEILNIASNPAITFAFPDDLPSPEVIEKLQSESIQAAEEKLKVIASEYFLSLSPKTSVLEGYNSASDILIEYAKQNTCNLIIIASHGRGLIGRVTLGSFAETVLRHASCPVLVIPCNVACDINKHHSFERILVTTDFSDASKNAIGLAINEANRSNAKLNLINVLENPFAPELLNRQTIYSQAEAEKFQQNYKKRAQEQLSQFSNDFQLNRQITTEVINKTSSVANSITEFARTSNTNLIVISTRGAGNRIMLFAGVVEKVVRHAPCPVLVVPN